MFIILLFTDSLSNLEWDICVSDTHIYERAYENSFVSMFLMRIFCNVIYGSRESSGIKKA